MSQMKPILFNTEMVKAILDGRKTVTRRLVKPQPVCYGPNRTFNAHDGDFFLSAEKNWLRCRTCGHDPEYSREGSGIAHHWEPRFVPGDILYVRETWCDPTPEQSGYPILYKADMPMHWDAEDVEFGKEVTLKAEDYKWRPSIHMPKEAARIFLRVTGVWVERLQDIDAAGIRAEGLGTMAAFVGDIEIARAEFRNLWDSTIKPASLPTCGWGANPWVWAYKFERINK